MIAFELAVQDLDGIAVAARVGADRIELCSALAVGGVTPSTALVEAAVGAPGVPPVHVLVRPRAAGFEYTPDEVALAVREVAHVVRAGASGVVIGGTRNGRVDEALVRASVDAAEGREVTFHRAFDTVDDLDAALETLVTLGVARILTSGGADRADQAVPVLARLAAAAGDRLDVMAGSGVTAGTVPALVGAGVHAVHASAKRLVHEGVGVALGSAASDGAVTREVTDEAEARRILAAIRTAHGSDHDATGSPRTPGGTE